MQEGERSAQTVVERTYPIGRGRVEIVPEPEEAAPPSRLRRNLADTPTMLLFGAACLAQIGDAVTTWLGLSRHGRFEANFLMRYAVNQPVTVGLLKVLLVALLCTLALMRLPTQRARVALLLAFGLSVVAPIQNMTQLFGS
jgi:hypothetical protein